MVKTFYVNALNTYLNIPNKRNTHRIFDGSFVAINRTIQMNVMMRMLLRLRHNDSDDKDDNHS